MSQPTPGAWVLSFEYPGDERIDILVNDEVLVSLNHDEHGWSGMDVAVQLAKAIARKVGARVVPHDD